MTFDLDAAKKVVSAWERTAAQLADAAVRDPRTLDLGARLLRAQLLWKKAFDTALDAWWAPLAPGPQAGAGVVGETVAAEARPGEAAPRPQTRAGTGPARKKEAI